MIRQRCLNTLRDSSLLPGSRLEALEGGRKGRYSIRIKD
jgi:plasmid maintenance system killer protein